MAQLKINSPPGSAVYGFSQISHGNMALSKEWASGEVLTGRDAFLSTLFNSPPPLFTLRQVHGNRVVLYDDEGAEELECSVGDASITRSRRVSLGVLTADCLPIILLDRASTAVGVIHAGRMGSLKEITGITVKRFSGEFNISPRDVFVVFGPGISSCCYEVREDALKPFESSFSRSEIARKYSNESWKLDLQLINVRQILECGVPLENITPSTVCTMCGPDYFSFRRDGTKKRFLTVVSLAGRSGQ